jgi:hypothetical protein
LAFGTLASKRASMRPTSIVSLVVVSIPARFLARCPGRFSGATPLKEGTGCPDLIIRYIYRKM